MANRRFRSQFTQSWAGMPVRLHCHVTFGATGAPTLVASDSTGIASVTRNSAGNYTIALSDNYNKLLGLESTQLSPSAAPAAPIMCLASQQVSSATAPQLVVQYYNATTATDPASGEALFLTLILNNSSVG